MESFEKIEYERINKEIQSDRETQFRIFLQTLMVIGAIFVAIFKIEPVPKGELLIAMFLPIWILSHASLTMIYSRARSHNRKSAYLLVAYTEYGTTSSWEKDMWVLRWNTRGVHRPDTFKQISIVLCMIQFAVFLFILVNTYINGVKIAYMLIGCFFSFIFIWALMSQTNNFFCLKYRDSIEGFAEYWTMVLNKNEWKRCSWLLDQYNSYPWVETPKPWLEKEWLVEFWEASSWINKVFFRVLLKIPRLVEEIPQAEMGRYATVKLNKITFYNYQ